MRRKPKKFAQFLTERINELVKNGRIIPCPDYKEPESKIVMVSSGDKPTISLSEADTIFSFSLEDFPPLGGETSALEAIQPYTEIMRYDNNERSISFTDQDFPPLGETSNIAEG